MFDSVNGTVTIDGAHMDYISFGNGGRTLIMLPGLGDGLKTVKGKAAPFSVMYKEYAADFRVYLFSRKNELPKQYTSREMARGQKAAMDALGIKKADVMGVSQGGTIAQYLAIDYPEAVNRLVLAVTYSRQNETIRSVVGKWKEYAEAGDHAALITDTAERSYSEKYLKKYRKFLSLSAKLTKPASYDRFLTMADAVLSHDAYDELAAISCPTLVIGGKEDKIVTPDASYEISEAIKGSELYMYDGLGHAAYEEAKDFNSRVIAFLKK